MRLYRFGEKQPLRVSAAGGLLLMMVFTVTVACDVTHLVICTTLGTWAEEPHKSYRNLWTVHDAYIFSFVSIYSPRKNRCYRKYSIPALLSTFFVLLIQIIALTYSLVGLYLP